MSSLCEFQRGRWCIWARELECASPLHPVHHRRNSSNTMRSPKSSRKWAVHWEIYWLNHPHWKWQWQGHYLIAQRTYEYETMHPAQLRHRNLQFKHYLTNPLIIYESTQHAIVTDPIRWFLLKLLHIREVDSTFYLKWCSLCLHSREDQSNNSAHSHSSIRFVFYKLQFD